RESSAVLREHGLDLDMTALIYPGQRSHVMDYLSEKGWQVTGVSRTELFTRHGLALPPAGEGDALGEIVYVSATTPG
ncbi:SAM-dependent methyltransferase, partial [Mycolicibacterium insubricum]|nr:SAM-dependent methyltransferase [Mycolicibacterium insubricum]